MALPVSSEFWAKLAPSAGWEDFYLALLLDNRTRDFHPKLVEPGIRHALELRVLYSRVAGHVDYVDHWEVRGWCADRVRHRRSFDRRDFRRRHVHRVLSSAINTDPMSKIWSAGVVSMALLSGFLPIISDLFQTDRWISAREQTTRRVFGCILSPRSSLPERIGELGRLRKRARADQDSAQSDRSRDATVPIDSSGFRLLRIANILRHILRMPTSDLLPTATA